LDINIRRTGIVYRTWSCKKMRKKKKILEKIEDA